ncbi:MAG: protein-disulfide reductase DsbD [Cardiobacteriaceae bacterium]|nr:protein-disulfide reductase DsbD [Cardiobacteriaceae bacterium]
MKHLLTSLLIFFSAIVFADDPRPAKEIFIPSISQEAVDGKLHTTVHITMPERYYLYVDKTDLRGKGIEGTLEKMPGKEKEDPFFGKQTVWYGEGALTLIHDAPATTFTLKAQGCEEDAICYPPTSWTLEVEPATPAANAMPSPAAPKLFGNKNDVLPEAQAFPVHALSDNGQALVHIAMPAGYYLYRDKFTASVDGRPLQPLFPPGETHTDEFFGEQTVYRSDIDIPLPLSAADNGKEVVVRFQGCADAGVCYPPMTRTLTFGELSAASAVGSVAQTAPIAAPDSNIHPIQRALTENFWINLPWVLLLGISVSFTACVYPLIPIVTSLVVGKNSTKKQSFALIGVYVLGMAGAMALVGALFGLFDVNLQLILQKPVFVIIAALIFVALSLSMFDIYTLQTPRWLQKPVDRLTRKQQSGSYAGAAIMGALSVLVVSSCATPVLAALLLFTAQTTTFKSAVALFVFGLGTGLPLFLFASVFRQYMPKAGAWMDAIKRAFGFGMLAIALWLITRILPLALGLALWAVYAAFAAFYLFPPQEALPGKATSARRFAALLTAIFAIALANQALSHWLAPQHVSAPGAVASPTPFREIANETAFAQALAASDKPVILDFYADWCISCKVWERDIWHNPAFAADLADFTLLKVDVTDFNAEHQAMFQRLNVVAPPTVLVYPAHGTADAPLATIVGEMKAEDFRAALQKWR